jgi:hypothetical protein
MPVPLRNVACIAIAVVVGTSSPVRAEEAVEHRYEQSWCSARDDEEAPYIFGTPSQVRTDEEAHLYVLDTQLQELHRFGPEGDYQGRIIGSGEGPGELARCYSFSIWPGERLAVPRAQGTVTVFDLDGIYVESIAFGSEDPIPLSRVASAHRHGEGVLIRGERFNPHAQSQELVLGIYSSGGELRHELHAKTRPQRNYNLPSLTIKEADSFFPGSRFVLGGDGLAYVAPRRDSFEIVTHDMEGRTVGRIEVDWPVHARTPEEIEATKGQYVIAGDRGVKLPDVTYEIEETAPMIQQLLWVDGSLWVEVASETESDDTVGRFVVVGDDGRIAEVRDVILPGTTSGDRVKILSDGRIVVAKNYRAAVRARYARYNTNIRVGGERSDNDSTEAEDDGVYLIVYEPVP